MLVSDILARAALIAGYRTTGSEQQLAIDAYNAWYSKVCRKSGNGDTTANYTVTASQDYYDVTAVLAGASASRVNNVSFCNTTAVNAPRQPLKQVGHRELNQYRFDAGSTGIPEVYAMLGTRKIGFFPNPQINSIITVNYSEKPVLYTTAASATATPALVDDEFHPTLMVYGTLAGITHRDGNLAVWQSWVQMAESYLSDYDEFVDSFGGESAPLMTVDDSAAAYYPDQRSRRTP